MCVSAKDFDNFEEIDRHVMENDVVVFYEKRKSFQIQGIRKLLTDRKKKFIVIDVNSRRDWVKKLQLKTGITKYPIIFYHGLLIQPEQHMQNLENIILTDVVSADHGGTGNVTDFDVVVIGGGAAGTSFAKSAMEFDKRVCVIDFVDPSPRGISWGYGGTCVNVGCIPKRLHHDACLMGEHIEQAIGQGYFKGPKTKCEWNTVSKAIQLYIKGLNFKYRVQLKKNKIHYENAKVKKILGSGEVEVEGRNGVTKTITCGRIVLACGCRPFYPQIEGVNEMNVQDYKLKFFFIAISKEAKKVQQKNVKRNINYSNV